MPKERNKADSYREKAYEDDILTKIRDDEKTDYHRTDVPVLDRL